MLLSCLRGHLRVSNAMKVPEAQYKFCTTLAPHIAIRPPAAPAAKREDELCSCIGVPPKFTTEPVGTIVVSGTEGTRFSAGTVEIIVEDGIEGTIWHRKYNTLQCYNSLWSSTTVDATYLYYLIDWLQHYCAVTVVLFVVALFVNSISYTRVEYCIRPVSSVMCHFSYLMCHMIVSERDVMRYQPHTWHGWLRIKVEGTLKGDTFCYHKVTGTLAHWAHWAAHWHIVGK